MESYFSTTSKSLDDLDVHGILRRLVKKDVSLLNYYKEVPVTYSARLLDYDTDGIASLTCHPVQARLMDFDRYTILRHGAYSFKAAFMGIKQQSRHKQEILLSRFLPAEVYTDKRELVRVSHDNPIIVSLVSDGIKFSAEMIDSSATSFKTKPVPDLPIEVRGTARAGFVLPLGDGPVTIEADVVLVKSTSETQVYRMDISKADESSMMRYINQRQIEIIKELNLEVH
jgi:hypothetical protein